MARAAPGSERGRDRRWESLIDGVVRWANDDTAVRAVVLVGSRARTNVPADRWSDTDLVVFTSEPDRLLASWAWTRRFGTPAVTFVESTAVGGSQERRVLYSDGYDVDFAIFPARSLRGLLSSPAGSAVLARGFRVLLDKDRLLDQEERAPHTVAHPKRARPPRATFRNAVADFWYHCVWASKKLRRGELWVAKDACDGHLKALLLTVLEWHAQLRRRGAVDTWHSGRFLERWGDPRFVRRLRRTFARYDPKEVESALRATMDLFHDVATESGRRLGVRYAHAEERAARRMVARVLDRID